MKEHEDHGELEVPITPLSHFLDVCESRANAPDAVEKWIVLRPSILVRAFSKARRSAPAPKITGIGSSTKRGFQSLRFLDQKATGHGWHHVEKRFDEMAVEGKLSKENFGRCIGEELHANR